jgi:hypothetical protein
MSSSSLIAVTNENESKQGGGGEGEERRQFHNFINSIRSATTKKSHLWYLDKYKGFLQNNKRPLLIIQDSKIVENKVIDFLLSEKQRGLSYNSVTTSLNAVAHFYIMNDIILNRKKIRIILSFIIIN